MSFFFRKNFENQNFNKPIHDTVRHCEIILKIYIIKFL